MEATTITGLRPDTLTDPTRNPAGRWGDVDINGDLVDELTWQLGSPSMRAMARERRLAAAISGATSDLERDQFQAVLRALERFPA